MEVVALTLNASGPMSYPPGYYKIRWYFLARMLWTSSVRHFWCICNL